MYYNIIETYKNLASYRALAGLVCSSVRRPHDTESSANKINTYKQTSPQVGWSADVSEVVHADDINDGTDHPCPILEHDNFSSNTNLGMEIKIDNYSSKKIVTFYK